MNKKGMTRLKEMLVRSLDRELSPSRRRELDAALRDSPELQEEIRTLQGLRKAVTGSRHQAFREGFADRVLARLQSHRIGGMEGFYLILRTSFRKVVLVGLFVLLALLFYNMKIGDSLSSDEAFFAPDLAYMEILGDLPE